MRPQIPKFGAFLRHSAEAVHSKNSWHTGIINCQIDIVVLFAFNVWSWLEMMFIFLSDMFVRCYFVHSAVAAALIHAFVEHCGFLLLTYCQLVMCSCMVCKCSMLYTVKYWYFFTRLNFTIFLGRKFTAFKFHGFSSWFHSNFFSVSVGMTRSHCAFSIPHSMQAELPHLQQRQLTSFHICSLSWSGRPLTFLSLATEE